MGAKDNRRAKRIEKTGMRWEVHALHLVGVEREADSMALALQVQWEPLEQHYLAVAISTPIPADPAGREAFKIEDVFDNHSHQVMGTTFATETEAKTACEQFAIEWLRSGEVAEACDCGEIVEPLPLAGMAQPKQA